MNNQETRQELLERVVGMNQELVRITLGSTGNVQDSEDIAQDTFVQILEQLDCYDPQRATPETWVRTILFSRTIDYLRKRRRRNARISLGIDGHASCEEMNLYDQQYRSPFASLEHEEDNQIIRRSLESLPPDTRDLIILNYYLEFSQRKIGNLLGIPKATIKSRVRRGREQMKGYYLAVQHTI